MEIETAIGEHLARDFIWCVLLAAHLQCVWKFGLSQSWLAWFLACAYLYACAEIAIFHHKYVVCIAVSVRKRVWVLFVVYHCYNWNFGVHETTPFYVRHCKHSQLLKRVWFFDELISQSIEIVFWQTFRKMLLFHFNALLIQNS